MKVRLKLQSVLGDQILVTRLGFFGTEVASQSTYMAKSTA